MNPRVNVVNVGATDPELAAKFFAGLGWEAQPGGDGWLELPLASATVALWDWDALAAQARVSPASTGFRGWTLSAIFESAAEVDAVMAAAQRGGATITKPARAAMWGGYSGYFADLDGHLWKIVSDNKPPRGRRQREEAAARVEAQGQPQPTSIAVTLGVGDVKESKAFYGDDLGCPVDKSFGGKFASFDLGEGSATLALYTREGLAKDAGVAVEGHGFTGLTLSSLVGTAGSFADPDGFLWHVATAP